MMKLILTPIAVFLVLGATSVAAMGQTAAKSPFHNLNSPATSQSGPNSNLPTTGSGSISIPQIMPTKRPLPRKPVQPVFVMKGIDLGADQKIQKIDKLMRSYSAKLIEARQTRNNGQAMRYVRKMEQARQKLLRHLREVAPVEKSFAPIPTAKDRLPTLPAVNPAIDEAPILPMPKMPGGDKRK